MIHTIYLSSYSMSDTTMMSFSFNVDLWAHIIHTNPCQLVEQISSKGNMGSTSHIPCFRENFIPGHKKIERSKMGQNWFSSLGFSRSSRWRIAFLHLASPFLPLDQPLSAFPLTEHLYKPKVLLQLSFSKNQSPTKNIDEDQDGDYWSKSLSKWSRN